MGNTPPSFPLAHAPTEDAGDTSVTSPTTISSEIGAGTSRLLGGNDSSRVEASEAEFDVDNRWNLRWSDLAVVTSEAPIAERWVMPKRRTSHSRSNLASQFVSMIAVPAFGTTVCRYFAETCYYGGP